MKKTRIIYFISLVLISQVAYAQFGSILKKKNPIKNTLTSGTSSKDNIDWEAQTYLPAIELMSILSNDGLKLELDGTLKISTLEISFLPNEDKDGNPVNYDPYQREDFLLTAQLSDKKDGKLINTFYFSVNPVSRPFSLMSAIHRPNKEIHQEVKIKKGQYQLDFFVGKQEITYFEFEVIESKNADPYAAMPSMYFLSGAWDEYGGISYSNLTENKPINFECHILNATTDVENAHRPNKSKEVKFTATISKGSTVIAASKINVDGNIAESIANGRRGYYQKLEIPFYAYPAPQFQNGSKPDYFTMKDLSDGNYSLEIERELFEGGKKTDIYPFTIKNGVFHELKHASRQQHSDITTLIESKPNMTILRKS